MNPRHEYDPSRHSPFRSQTPAPGGHAPPPQYGGQQPGYGGTPPIGYGGGYGTHPQWQQPAPAQSGMGVSSFLLALIGGVALISLFVVAGVMGSRNPGGMDEKSPAMIGLGLGLIAGLVMTIIGLVLGIVAVLQRDRKKVFAVLGLIFNALILVGVVGLIALGMAVS